MYFSLERRASLGGTPPRAQPLADPAAVAARVRVLELVLQGKEEELAIKGKKVPPHTRTPAFSTRIAAHASGIACNLDSSCSQIDML